MSVNVTCQALLTVVETLPAPLSNTAANTKVTHDIYNQSDSLNSGSTPPVTKVATFEKAMSGGAGTIDLTSLPGTNGATISGSGLKVQRFLFVNPGTNANAITIVGGASNGYLLFGASGSVVLNPGDFILRGAKDTLPDIGGSAKTIDISGTGTQALQCCIVMG